jgi:hypothetical protein
MNQILEEVFLHKDVRGGFSIGFQTTGLGDVRDRFGYIVRQPGLGAALSIRNGRKNTLLTAYHLQTIADRLRHLDARQEKVKTS